MTALELIRSKQRMEKAAKDHAEAVKQRQEEEDAEKFAPLKKIYEEVRHLPAKPRYNHSNSCTETIKGMWESRLTPRHIEFWNDIGGGGGWNLTAEGGTIYLVDHYRDIGKTEDIEEAKGWLVEKLATMLEDEK
jgi:hypothetical protein